MPRLLSINNYHYRRGGADAVYLEHAKLIESCGWTNAFFSMRHPRNRPSRWARFFVDEIEFEHSYPPIRKIAMATKVVYSVEAQHKLRALLAEYPADIAHLHCIYHHLSPSILPTLTAAGVPIVMTAHDLKIACPAYKMLNRTGICERCKDGKLWNVVRYRCIRDSPAASAVVAIEALFHRVLDTYRKHLAKIIVPSKFFLRKFVEWGWPEDKFIYIPNCVDVARLRPSFETGDYFLYFGRLAPEKGLSTLLRAAHDAKVRVKIAGSGPSEVDLQQLQSCLRSDVEFVGYRSGEDLHELVRRARAIVLPSEWYENAPMSLLESMALGKPVIAANIGGIPELVVAGETGWVFEARSVDQLTELLRCVWSLPNEKIATRGRAARSFVEKNFSSQIYLEAMISLYASLGVRM